VKRSIKAVTALLLGALALGVFAHAGTLHARDPATVRLVRVGHDSIDMGPTARRYTGMVTALGTPDSAGRIYSFAAKPVGPGMTPPAPDALRGWRLTMLAGDRFANAFEVKGNTESEVTVVSQDGPLNGLAVSDVFIIEEVAVVRPDNATPNAAPGSGS